MKFILLPSGAEITKGKKHNNNAYNWHTVGWVAHDGLHIGQFVTTSLWIDWLIDWLIDLRPCQHDNGYMDGRSQIKVHTNERTQVHSAQSSLAVTHPSTKRARHYLTSVTESLNKHWSSRQCQSVKTVERSIVIYALTWFNLLSFSSP